jgi:hypothetical protein
MNSSDIADLQALSVEGDEDIQLFPTITVCSEIINPWTGGCE